MKKLYEIQTELEQLLNEAHEHAELNGGEIPDDIADKIDDLYGDKEEKIISCIRYYKNLSAEMLMVKNEEDKLKKRRLSITKKIDTHKNYMAEWLNGEKFKKGSDSISYLTSESIHIPEDIKYDETLSIIAKLEPKWDKKKIKEEILKDNKDIKDRGFLILETKNIQIK